MATIAELIVRASVDNRGLNAGLSAAQRRVKEFSDGLNSTLGGVLTFGAITAGLGALFRASDQLDASMRQLSATARITGQNLGFLQTVSQNTDANFRVGARTANQLSIELTKLTSKAGQVAKTEESIGALLDLGAARGMGTEASLIAIRQAILGIDEGTDKLFGKNPIVIYTEFARSIGTTAGKLNDAQKAQAILNELMVTGGKVAGEYGEFLKSPAGQQEILRLRTEDAAAAIGRSLNAMRTTAIPVFLDMVEGVRAFVGGIQIMAAQAPAAIAKVGLWITQFGALVLRGMAAGIRALSTFAEYVGRLPAPVRRLLGIGDAPATAQRGFAFAAGLEAHAANVLASARRQLQFAREAASEITDEIVASMNNALAISGPTNPLENLLVPQSTTDGLQKVGEALREQGNEVGRVAESFKQLSDRGENVRSVLDRALTLHRDIESSLSRQTDLTSETTVELRRQAAILAEIVARAPNLRPVSFAAPTIGTGGGTGGSLFGGDLAPELTRTQEALAALSEVTYEAMAGLRTFGASVMDFGRSQLQNAISGLASLAAQLTPAGLAASAFATVVDTLRPVVEALLVPVSIVAQVFAAGLIPVLKLLFPIIRAVGIVFTYLQEITYRVIGAVVGGFGFLLRALGNFINAITPFANPGNPLVRAGRAMERTASGFLDAAREAARARDELRSLTFENALQRASEGLDRLTATVVNAAEGFKAEKLRFNAQDASASLLPPTAPRTSASVQGGPTTQIYGNVTVEINGRDLEHLSLQDLGERVVQALKLRQLTNPQSAPVVGLL